MESVSRDLKLSLRQIRRQPGFAAAIILTLGLSIGATTAVFSFVNALLIRPFPFRDADQLAEICSVRGGQPGKVSMQEILDIRRYSEAVESIAARTGDEGGYNFSGEGGKPEEWKTILTTGNLFEVLGAPLAIGSRWADQQDATKDYSVILSYDVWQRCFGGRRDIVGKSVTLDHAAGYLIHGVAARGLDFPRGIEVYRSIGGFAHQWRDSRWVLGIVRIKQRFTVRQLQAELDAVGRRLAETYPATNAGVTFRATPFRDIYTGDVRPYLLVLMGAVGFVLLIACANVVNLLLSRALTREREIAVRVALGARRRDILRQLLTESTMLSLIAAGFGLALAYWWMKLLRALIGLQLPQWMRIDLDGRVLAFTLAIAVVAGIVSGFAPALHLTRGSLGESLKEAARGSSGGRFAARLRDGMIIAEVALALVLLVGAGLLIRGFLELQSQEKGFRADSLATFRVALGWKRYSGDATTRYYERAMEQLQAIRGVESAGFVYAPPLAGLEVPASTVQAEGQPVDQVLRNPYVNLQSTSETYFSVMNIPLRAGRLFTRFDRKGSEPVAIVSERLARLLWPGRNPIGQRLRSNPLERNPSPFRTVVGIAGNVQQDAPGGEPSLDVYVPFRQSEEDNHYIIVKTGLPLAEFQRLAERALWTIDPEQSVFDFKTYDQRILESIWQLRISRLLLVLFGVIAVVLSAIGVYGVMSCLAGQRAREMGIRMALGATPGSVRALIVGRGVLVGSIGLGIGLAGAVCLGRLLAHTLRGISAADSLSFTGALVLLLAVTAAACAVPAWRASQIDPAVTLREE